MDYLDSYSSPLGEITLASDGSHLIELCFKDGRYAGETVLPGAAQKEHLSVF